MSQTPGQNEEANRRSRGGAAGGATTGGAAAAADGSGTGANIAGAAAGVVLGLASILGLVSCQSNAASDQTYQQVIDYNATSGQ